METLEFILVGALALMLITISSFVVLCGMLIETITTSMTWLYGVVSSEPLNTLTVLIIGYLFWLFVKSFIKYFNKERNRWIR